MPEYWITHDRDKGEVVFSAYGAPDPTSVLGQVFGLFAHWSTKVGYDEPQPVYLGFPTNGGPVNLERLSLWTCAIDAELLSEQVWMVV